MAKIIAEEARQMLETLPGWQLDGETLRRQFTFPGFADAVAFAVRLAFDAEAADHHPGILIEYKRVTLGFTTHSAGGLTSRDFDGAREATALATRLGATGARG
jgi:4a-hydroxytetrahydrobiopterin dehydratase